MALAIIKKLWKKRFLSAFIKGLSPIFSKKMKQFLLFLTIKNEIQSINNNNDKDKVMAYIGI